jgi:hypothetical protein
MVTVVSVVLLISHTPRFTLVMEMLVVLLQLQLVVPLPVVLQPVMANHKVNNLHKVLQPVMANHKVNNHHKVHQLVTINNKVNHKGVTQVVLTLTTGTKEVIHGEETKEVTHGVVIKEVIHGEEIKEVIHGEETKVVIHGVVTKVVIHGVETKEVTHGVVTKVVTHGEVHKMLPLHKMLQLVVTVLLFGVNVVDKVSMVHHVVPKVLVNQLTITSTNVKNRLIRNHYNKPIFIL